MSEPESATSRAHPSPSDLHSPQIAAIRGLAIAGVVQCHYLALPGVYDAFSVASPIGEALTACGGGVDLFFVLSAFLLTRGLLRRRLEPNATLDFYRRRALRILPAYWLLIACGFALAPLLANAGCWAAWLWGGSYSPGVYLAFLQNWLIGVDGIWRANFFAHTWSLAVEEQFYLVIPLIVIGADRRRSTMIAVVAIVTGPAIRMIVGADVSIQAAYCWPIARMDAFGWGMLAALFACARPDLLPKIPARGLAAGSMTLFAVFGAVAHPAIKGNVEALSIYLAVIDALAAALVLATAAASHGSPLERRLPHRWLAWMGERCYSIYLFHNAFFGLAMLAANIVWPDGGLSAQLLATLSAFVGLLYFADLSYRWIEQPLIAFGRRAPPPPMSPVLSALARVGGKAR